MKIVAVADLHGKAPRLERLHEITERHRPDAVVVAGDVTAFFRVTAVLQALDRLPAVVFFVRGNTDRPALSRRSRRYATLHDLHGTTRNLGGIAVTGLGGTLPLPFRTRISLQEETLLEKAPKAAGPRSVLVCHPPPWGLLDKVGGRFHAGSKGVRRYIEAHAPGVVLCGHIHEAPGAVQVGKTLVVNCSVGRKSKAALITMDGTTPPDVTWV
jgi:Icc-related predicted phosphoesterase